MTKTGEAPSRVQPRDGAGPREPGYYLEILLVSFAGLLLEISYTRIVSFKLFYYYTYLVIGLALLGIGTGGVLVTISRRLNRAATDTILMWSLLLGAASVGVGYVIVARVSIDTLAIWDYGSRASFSNLARLLLICVALFVSFVPIGIVVTTLLGRKAERIGRLYFADLVGAGLACVVVVSLIAWIGPPATIILAGLLLALLGLRIAARGRSRALFLAAPLAVVLAVVVAAPSTLPRQRTDASKADVANSHVIYSAWSPIFRVDVVQLDPNTRILIHDDLLGSVMYRWNGDPATLTRYDTDPRILPFAVAGTKPPKMLIIGAAGGNEVLASLHFGARHIDAVELNPVTYSLVTKTFAAYDGHLADNPRVNYVNGDGRSYLARSSTKYRIVWFPAPDSYAATNAATAGANVLSESYLYTSEAVTDSLKHLAPGGIVAAQFGELAYETRPNRTTRYVATARHALDKLGIRNPASHILVATSAVGGYGKLSTILVKRTPFTRSEIANFVGALSTVPGSTLRYAPGRADLHNTVTTVATSSSSQLAAFYRDHSYAVGPITDNQPFFWHFARFQDVIGQFGNPVKNDPESGIGERVLLLLLAIAIVLAAVALLIPFVTIRQTWKRLPKKRRSAVYFTALGLGFIFFEITLIQLLVLFLGYPTYSLTVTLMSILIFTGVGAFLTGRYKHRQERVMPILLGALVVLTIFYLFGLPPLTSAAIGLPLALRVPIAFLILAPLGLCLGAFMPLGLGAVADITEFPREYVAWGWAVNGFASVIGSVLTTILAMSFGFRAVLVVALLCYVIAVIALRGLTGTRSSAPAPA
jgi:MFS family permease